MAALSMDWTSIHEELADRPAEHRRGNQRSDMMGELASFSASPTIPRHDCPQIRRVAYRHPRRPADVRAQLLAAWRPGRRALIRRKDERCVAGSHTPGTPVLIDELLYKPSHSLIDQSLHSRLGVETTNGDGFGVGWYGEANEPAVFKSIEPAWNDRNLRELSRSIRSGPRLRAHPRVDRNARAADELPPVPPRPLALDAQRVDHALPRRQAGAPARRRPLALPGDGGLDGLGGVLLPRPDLRARG